MNSDVQPHTPSEPGTSAASPVNQNPTGVTWEANLPSAREFVKERIDHVLSQLLPESRVGAQLFEALHSVKGFSSADAQHQIRGLLISVLRADATLETFAQNIARRPDDADKISLAVLLQQRSVKEALKPYVQESLGSTAKPELINQKAAEVQRVLVEASKAIKIVEVSVAQEVSRPQRFEAGLKAFNNSPFFVHGLSQERMQPMLNSDTPAQASMFGLGCVTSVGVGGGIALEVLGMYFRQALFNRMFEIPKAVVVIARNIAQASAHVETDNAEHKRQLDRILDWHLVVASRIREFDPSFEVITDIELERSAAWEQAAATRANIEGLPHVNRYSVRQDITVEATRLAYGATVKGGWTTWEADSPIEYERLLVRPGMPEAGSCEGGFDHYS
ncbi:MAG: hypothetical protein J0M12_07080, partial [Deltaproteobacteria bacterium]|nr:hypothetical protein [Deltaproteobacteria bacterium]